MKKVFNLFALVFCFTLLAATAIDAQGSIRNGTNCAFEVYYCYAFSCTPIGCETVTAPALSVTPISVPAGKIIAARGSYVNSLGAPGFDCMFRIESVGCGDPYEDVPCSGGSLSCGDYTAELVQGDMVIWLHH